MVTRAAELIAPAVAKPPVSPLTVCHVTVAHTQLKSRSFHRQFMPLAAAGVNIRYAAPAAGVSRRDGVEFVALPERANGRLRLHAIPRLLRTLLQQRASLYHFQDPQLLPIAFVLKLLFRKRIVYDAYEDFPSIAARHRSIPRWARPVAARIVAFLERLAAMVFDGIITADPPTLRRLARQGKCRKMVFYNFPNLDFFPPPNGQPKRFDLVYRGGLSERTGTFLLVDSMNELASLGMRPRLLLIGYFDDNASERKLRQRISELALDPYVEIRGRIEHEDMACALSEARIGISPLQPIPKFQLNVPVKIFEYWACGLPVIASDLVPMRPFFRDGYAGLLFPAGSVAELTRSIVWMLDHPDEAARMGRNGRNLVAQRLNNAGEVAKLHRFCSRITAMP